MAEEKKEKKLSSDSADKPKKKKASVNGADTKAKPDNAPASGEANADDDADIEFLFAALAGPFLVAAMHDELSSEKQEALVEVMHELAGDELDDETIDSIVDQMAKVIEEKGDDVFSWISATLTDNEDREEIFALTYYVAATPEGEPNEDEYGVLGALAEKFGFSEEKVESILTEAFSGDDEDGEEDEKKLAQRRFDS